MLENFVAPFDATVAVLLQSAGVKVSGRRSMGEFGAEGLFSEQSDILTDSVSSFANSGSDAMLCNDYTGAISNEAGRQGLYYIHPTYGSVSRYGLIPSVVSMDQIGVLCKDIKTGFEILKIIKQDKQVNHPSNSPACSLKKVLQPYYDIYPQIMQILCSAELANNISRYDGIKFGYRAKDYTGLDELYKKNRSEAFGKNIKLAALTGAMVLSKDNYLLYYDKAMRLRRLIKESLVFDVDTILTADSNQMNLFPALSRLCGFPSVTTPNGTYIANSGCEEMLYGI